MKSPKKNPVALPEGAFVLWARKLAEIISNGSGEAVPVELQTLIALASLIEAKILARGYNENVYFINPMIMFNGYRVSFVRSYVKKKKLKQGDPQQLSVFDAIPPFNID